MPASRKPKTRGVSVASETNDPESSPSPRASQNVSGDSIPIRKKARRAALTRNACIRCRLAKAKCSGKHPSCARCEASNATCVYDVSDEGVTRMQNLQQKLDVKTRDYDRVMVVLQELQSGTDNEAAGLLARLRLGESVEQVTQGMALPAVAGSTSSEFSSPQYQGSISRLQSWPPTPDQQTYTGNEQYFSQPAGSSPDLPLLAPKPVQPTHATTETHHEPLPYPTSTSPMDMYDTHTTHGHQPVAHYHDSNAEYRHLPQISFKGASWPAGVDPPMVADTHGFPYAPTNRLSPEIYQPRPMQPPSIRSPHLAPQMQRPRLPSSRNYDGFLWPCSTGDGMPGIGPQGISTDRRHSDAQSSDSYASSRGGRRQAF